MITNRKKQWLSYLMIAAGLSLLFFGARDLVESRIGQSQIAHDFGSQAAPAIFRQLQPRPARPQLGSAIAKLSIPRLDTQLFVVEGDDDANLRRGPGHLAGTAMPGADGNCVIAGHRDTHFRVLKDIRKGDVIVLDDGRDRFSYRVGLTSVVSPDNVSSLKPESVAKLHLVTCYPFHYVGPAPQRFVVEADLVRPTDSALTSPAASTAQVRSKPPEPAIVRRRPHRVARKPVTLEASARQEPVPNDEPTPNAS